MLSEISQNLPRWIERALGLDSFNSDQYTLALKPDTVIEMLKKGAQQTYRLYFRQDRSDKTRAVLLYKIGRNSFRRTMRLNIQEHEKGTKIFAEYKLSSGSIVLIIALWVVALLMARMIVRSSIGSAFFSQDGTSFASNLAMLFAPIFPIAAVFIFFQLGRSFAYLETSKTKENFNSIFREHIIKTQEVEGGSQ